MANTSDIFKEIRLIHDEVLPYCEAEHDRIKDYIEKFEETKIIRKDIEESLRNEVEKKCNHLDTLPVLNEFLEGNYPEEYILSNEKSIRIGDEGERLLAEEIKQYSALENCLKNVCIVDKSNTNRKSAECDMIILSPKGLFLLECKYWNSVSAVKVTNSGQWYKGYGEGDKRKYEIMPGDKTPEYQNRLHKEALLALGITMDIIPITVLLGGVQIENENDGTIVVPKEAFISFYDNYKTDKNYSEEVISESYNRIKENQITEYDNLPRFPYRVLDENRLNEEYSAAKEWHEYYTEGEGKDQIEKSAEAERKIREENRRREEEQEEARRRREEKAELERQEQQREKDEYISRINNYWVNFASVIMLVVATAISVMLTYHNIKFDEDIMTVVAFVFYTVICVLIAFYFFYVTISARWSTEKVRISRKWHFMLVAVVFVLDGLISTTEFVTYGSMLLRIGVIVKSAFIVMAFLIEYIDWMERIESKTPVPELILLIAYLLITVLSITVFADFFDKVWDAVLNFLMGLVVIGAVILGAIILGAGAGSRD